MAYATQNDLLQRVTMQQLIQLTDDAKLGQVNASVVQGELDEATGIIDGYCREKYVTPLQASNVVLGLCRDIAIYALYSRRPQGPPEYVRDRYQDAIKTLKSISAGTMVLDQPVGSPTPQTSSAGGVKPSRNREVFSERHLEGY